MNDELQLSRDEKTFGMLAHITAFALFILPTIGHIIGPLIIWLMKKDQSAWVDRQGKNALNFQISITIYFFVSLLLIPVIIGIILVVAVAIFWLVSVIMASVRVNDGEDYQYMFSINFIK